MEQLSFSQEPNEKLFFLGALAGLGKMGAARAAAAGAKKVAATAAKKVAVSKLSIPIKISTGDINIGNKKQEN